MARRLNKKLLLGLGSTLGFLGTGVVSGFGIQAVIKNNSNIIELNQINRLTEQSYQNASEYNQATDDMFINTSNLKSFHFGDVQKSQTVTPYGWLGVFEDSQTISNRIALTSWSGEILWINEEYKDIANPSNNNANYNVYDMKYDWNTDLIFVLRTASENGFLNNGNTGIPELRLDVLDAKTGIKKDQISNTDFSKRQSAAWTRLNNKFLNWGDSNQRARAKNLFQLDIASKPGTNQVLVSWMPNFMQLFLRVRSGQTIGDNAQNRLFSFADILDDWSSVATTILFKQSADKNVNHSTLNFNLRTNTGEIGGPGSPNWFFFHEW